MCFKDYKMRTTFLLAAIIFVLTGCANRGSQRPVSQPNQGGQYVARQPLSVTWPAQGKVIKGFDGGVNKGIEIAGVQGSPVLAAAGGRVVYANNTLKGYGNLIIIKHDSTYLTIYGNNKVLLVKEGELVNGGQKIAEMGNGDSSIGKLIFEIRQNEVPVDPIPYLSPSSSGSTIPGGESSIKPPSTNGDIDSAKTKCKSLGFKEQTEAFGKCVIRLSK